ncbi:hypothetical protein OG259_41225 [Streptomyces sp. NBC_00250]|uniref:WD40 repeat domain-containing protein n=1 Tax=Streptomyces sp. NBC_00250 TaxID=2903641 RepID=UPI002E2CCEAB|nr:hypothetical protein [Streptomyces sp. NBC_00250]
MTVQHLVGTVLAAAETSTTGTSGTPLSCAFAPAIACATETSTMKLPTTPTTLVDPPSNQGKAHTGLVFTADGGTLAACNEAGIIRFWDVSNRKITNSITTDDKFEGLAYSPDGTMLASATADERVLLWNTDFRSRIDALSLNDAAVASSGAFNCLAGLLKGVENGTSSPAMGSAPRSRGYGVQHRAR